MLSRVLFLAIIAFWLVMNTLLWRSQTSEKNAIGSSVPIEAVWQKILTAPDNSSLDVYQHEKKIGFCHWTANLGQSTQATGKTQSEDYRPEGMVEQLTSYSLNIEGSTTIVSGLPRLRFEANLKLSAAKTWQEFHLHANLPPNSWDIRSQAKDEKVRLKIEGDDGPWQKTITFSELEHPEALLQEFGNPIALSLLGLTASPDRPMNLAGAMHWEAHEHRMQFGHSKVRVYRLESHLLGQTIYVFVSLVGEILWVELPDHITLRNEAFNHF